MPSRVERHECTMTERNGTGNGDMKKQNKNRNKEKEMGNKRSIVIEDGTPGEKDSYKEADGQAMNGSSSNKDTGKTTDATSVESGTGRTASASEAEAAAASAAATATKTAKTADTEAASTKGTAAESSEKEEKGTTDTNSKAASQDNLTEQLAEKEKLCKDYLDKLQRNAAEFDNYKKRTQREKEALYQDAVADVIASFLPIVDSLERAATAADSADEHTTSMAEGIQLIEKQIKEVLKKYDVSAMEGVGATFDPNFHNAVMHVEDDTLDKSVIAEEFLKGYLCKDRVVRHSMVKVAN